ncbi:MAG TPA: dTDP-4-dehydrorhamnose reductase [Chloroflexota bacterium]|nr:dTDP-4-dehydrorhamnose reductase [Chloroflexota bacterium]
MGRVLITGGGGQLAHDLNEAFGEEAIALPREQLDVTDRAKVSEALERWRPHVVVNTAAFHRVDRCEEEPEQSLLVNAAAPQRLAAACAAGGALFVHVSTDYVFDGTKGEPYDEGDPVNPISVYGASKAAGEMAIRATTPRHLIVRTSGLYGIAGRHARHGNFVERMLDLAGPGGPITVVSDQVLTPSYTVDVARTIVALVRREATGTVHVTNQGECSWYEFAREIFRLTGLEPDLRAARQADRPMPAARPAYSVLAHGALRRIGIDEPGPWQGALAEYIASRVA